MGNDRRRALKAAGIYGVVGALWIVCSDRVLATLAGDTAVLTQLQTYKGWLYVLVTAVLVYFLICRAVADKSRLLRDLRRSESDVKRLNAELERRVTERTAELETLNDELASFSYSVSHDLKAPLRRIDGFSRILVEEHAKDLGADGRELLDHILGGVGQMHELIEDLLAWSRMERSAVEGQILDIEGVVEEVLRERRQEIDEKGVVVRTATEPVRAIGDHEGLSIILRNLLGNALKFAKDAEPPTVEIGVRREGEKALLWVRDNGIGFDMRHHDRIFEIFHRLERSDRYPGTGIGLALVRKALQRMGGRVWAESAPGRGATFYVELREAGLS